MYKIICLLLCFPILLSAQVNSGFFDFEMKESSGKVELVIKKDQLEKEFLYVNSLAAGVGSNDIGLDRGQLGDERVVKFIKVGDKILMMQRNLAFRAISDNEEEVKAVEEAFAQSVVWGFPIKEQTVAPFKIDLTPFLLRDAHDVSGRLKSRNQGSYKLDAKRSAIWQERTKNFPKNSEFEALLTFAGEAKGRHIRSVAADSKSITVRQHHSFIELPDDNYTPRAFHPYSGYFNIEYADYASEIGTDMTTKLITRHRLQKKNPNAEISEPVEPIVYYIDKGCPEPVKSALIEGASWWDQAFQAAGFAAGTFSVKELPAEADPLDVRYNMIQWIHRSTRGWSYGASITDPRTGEILKGHVSLGSLRVRQDFLIAQGLIAPYDGKNNDNTQALEMALARLRQLSAHEVGHTIGLAHNFAASADDRASVMDYPHPLIESIGNKMNFNKAYDDKIGAWDKRAIIYGYTEFAEGANVEEELNKIIIETKASGLQYLSDQDARPAGGLNPVAHLWDNGTDVITELDRLMQVREKSLQKFGENNIPDGTPYSELEKVLVPIYLMHRYQAEAVSKLIGGVEYDYAVKGLDKSEVKAVDANTQKRATKSLLKTLNAKSLSVPKSINNLIPPSAHGYGRSRESFDSHTGLSIDPMAAAEGYTNEILSLMLHPQRLSRLARNKELYDNTYDLKSYLSTLDIQFSNASSNLDKLAQKTYFLHLLKLYMDEEVDYLIKSDINSSLKKLIRTNDYFKFLSDSAKSHPSEFKLPKMLDMPPGSPIGCGHVH